MTSYLLSRGLPSRLIQHSIKIVRAALGCKILYIVTGITRGGNDRSTRLRHIHVRTVKNNRKIRMHQKRSKKTRVIIYMHAIDYRYINTPWRPDQDLREIPGQCLKKWQAWIVPGPGLGWTLTRLEGNFQ